MPEDPTPGRRYRLVSKATGHELAICHIVTDDLASFHVVPITGGRGRIWEVESADIGVRLTTREAFDGELAALNGVARLDSNLERQVYAHVPNLGAFQKWRPLPDGEGFWQLINVATGFALDGSDQDIFTLRPNDGSFQRWGFLPA
jgi:hypothetical protein